ncbi:MAG: 3-mercaptopyruvate sulfurtransferase [Candidatus Rokuibacteriota bacterium]
MAVGRPGPPPLPPGRGSGVMNALVTTSWLAEHLGASDLRIVDGTWHMPALARNAREEFAEAHIPGAVFFDIDRIADTSVPLPHMLPSPQVFAASVAALGIGNDDRIVVYDVRGAISAARVWWTFRAFGHERVAVLDGGLRAWRAEGRPLERGETRPAPRPFRAHFRPELVRDLAAVRANVTAKREQVVDARSRGRFTGTEPEPRAGLRGGHVPGSLNVPYETLYRDDGTFLPPPALRNAFAQAGVELDKPIVTACGSGVTACVLALGLYVLGREDVAVYDGSWTEWGGRPDTPVDGP